MKSFLEKAKNFVYSNRLEIVLVLLIISVYGYFFSCGAWNQDARYNTIFAFVEPGTDDFLTFHIDHFIVDPKKGVNTGDWSFYDGHFYSNKAPGTALLGIPVYAVFFWIEELAGIPWQHPYIEVLNAYLINFFISVLPVGLGIMFFYKLLLLKGLTEKRGLLFALILAFSTCLFPYSTELWGHTTSTAFIIFMLYNIEKGKKFNFYAAGFYGGMATITDYLSVFITITAGIYILITNHRKILYFIMGGIFPLFLMLGYHYICFGNIFHTPIRYTNPAFLDQNRFLGIFGQISFSIILKLLISIERGILLAMPILIMAFPSLYFMIKKDKKSLKYGIFILGSILILLIANSSFNGWHGGRTACARYLIVTLPFWILLVSTLPDRKSFNFFIFPLALFSFFNMFVITSVCVQPLRNAWNPIYKELYPHFFKGYFNIQNYPIRLQVFHPQWLEFQNITSFNLGSLLGLEGFSSLFPLLMILVLEILLIRNILKNKETTNKEMDF